MSATMNDPAAKDTQRSEAGRYGSGQAVKRVEDVSLLAGKGQFTDNVPLDGPVSHIAFLRSPYAHARLKSVDVSGALALLHFVPVIGSFIVMAVLAFNPWPNGEASPGRR